MIDKTTVAIVAGYWMALIVSYAIGALVVLWSLGGCTDHAMPEDVTSYDLQDASDVQDTHEVDAIECAPGWHWDQEFERCVREGCDWTHMGACARGDE